MSIIYAPTPVSTLDELHLVHWAAAELPIDWRSHMRSRGLLVMLIHGTWCYACLEWLIWLRRRHSWLADLGIGALAISADNPSYVAAFRESLATPLAFVLISDADAALSRALGLYDEAAQTTRSALLLIDCAGDVRFGHLDEHAMPDQARLLEEIERLPTC